MKLASKTLVSSLDSSRKTTSELVDTRHLAGKGRVLSGFFCLELSCVAAFLVLLRNGQNELAVTLLLVPFQLLAWLALAGNGNAILVAFTALLPLAGARMLPYNYDRFVHLPGTLVLFCLLTLTGYLSANPTTRPRLTVPEWLPLVALAAWTSFSGANAVAHGWGTRILLIMTLVTAEVMILTYFFAVIPKSLKQVRVLIYTVVAAAVFVALWVPSFRGSSGVPGPTLGGKMVDTPFGSVNLNTIGYVMGPIAALALGMAVESRQRRTRFLLSAAVFLCVVMLVLTKSRGAWLGFGAAFLYVVMRRRSLPLFLLAAAVGAAVVLSDTLWALLASRAAATTAYDPSLLGRFLLWDYAWHIGKANWLLGVGMENFRYVKQLQGYPLPIRIGLDFNAHNIYLEAFADLGIVGLALFIWLLAGAFLRSSKAVGLEGASDLGLGLSAGIVAYAAHGLVDSILFQQGVFALLGMLVGLSTSLARLTETGSTAIGRTCGGKTEVGQLAPSGGAPGS